MGSGVSSEELVLVVQRVSRPLRAGAFKRSPWQLSPVVSGPPGVSLHSLCHCEPARINKPVQECPTMELDGLLLAYSIQLRYKIKTAPRGFIYFLPSFTIPQIHLTAFKAPQYISDLRFLAPRTSGKRNINIKRRQRGYAAV